MNNNIILYILFSVTVFIISSLKFYPRNFFGSASGEWTEIPSERAFWKIAVPLTNLIFLFLAWGTVNLPEMRNALLFYLILFLASSIIFLGELISPKKYPWALLLGDFNVSAVISGFLFGILWIIISVKPMTFVPSQLIISQSLLKILIIILVVLIAIIEESFFGGVSLPSFVEILGIIPSMGLNAIFFSLFHYMMYGLEMNMILILVCFRIAADSLNLRFRSIFPSITAHALINLISVL